MTAWAKRERPCVECGGLTRRRGGKRKQPMHEECGQARALRAALEMLAGIGEYAERWRVAAERRAGGYTGTGGSR